MPDWFPELARSEIERDAKFACVEVFDELPSTSDYALANAFGYCDQLPALFVARRQTKGRGRGVRSWFAGEGALTFSMLLSPADLAIDPSNWSRCSLIAGVAMCQTLEKYIEAGLLRVKWPNDVYLSGRKVCGILVEKRELGTPILCLGIGVNVNNSLEHAPIEVQQRAIALADVTHRKYFLPEILLEFLVRFRTLCTENSESLDALLPYWRQYCLLTGRKVETMQGENEWVGECHGIDGQGALLIQTSSGHRRVVSGEITRW